MEISSKNRLVAFLLSFFLGLFGAHRFYVGKIGSAIAMVILTLTVIGIWVTAVWAFIDWIVIACGNFRDADGKLIQTW